MDFQIRPVVSDLQSRRADYVAQREELNVRKAALADSIAVRRKAGDPDANVPVDEGVLQKWSDAVAVFDGHIKDIDAELAKSPAKKAL